MKTKKVMPIFVMGLFIFCMTLAFTFAHSSRNNKRMEENIQGTDTHSALKQDLVAESGEKIIEIVEASYQTSEIGLESSSLQIRNLSNRNITAIGIVWTITFTDESTCQTEQLVDYRPHKDMVEAKGIRAFAPYEEKFIPRLTKDAAEEGHAIKSVRVGFSFAEFEGSDGVGIKKSEMYKKLLSRRRGAEIYKRWIEKSYEENSQKIDGAVGKLSSDELPNDKELEDSAVKQGALFYKQWMKDILTTKGEDALRNQIHQQTLRQK
ncbi:MAG: hypothetical protein WBP93_06985 [Pyrinomonadaceae bacterium]